MVSEPGGDFGKFEAIAKAHRSHLYRRAVQLCRDREAAEDLVQDALYRAWRKYDSFKQGTDARAWMVTIMTRLYFDRRKHDAVIQRAQLQLVVLAQAQAEVPLISDDALQAALDSMAPELREIIELYYFKHMKYRQIAEVLQLPLGTIGTRLQRARSVLFAALNLPWDDDEP
jgi:RNA polymerase sigma-70 factor, ECF subfamily